MGNTPSGWVAPPYLATMGVASTSQIKLLTPATSYPAAVPAAIIIKGGDTVRGFLKFASPLNILKALGSHASFETQVAGIWPAGTSGAAYINFIVDGILGNFDPAAMTWNNQGALVYQNIYTGVADLYMQEQLVAADNPDLASRGKSVMIPLGFPAGFTFASPCYGVRISTTLTEVPATATALSGGWTLDPPVVIVGL